MANDLVTKPINQTWAWRRLQLHALARRVAPLNLREAFASNPNRSGEMSVRTEHAYFDYSRQLTDSATMRLLLRLAETAGLKSKIEAMFAGAIINTTEDRAVLHTALRRQLNDPAYVKVKAVLDRIRRFSNEVLSGTRTGVTGKKIKNIVAIGIGGSYLGPEYLAEACRKYAREGMTLRFVANVDATDFAQKTAGLNPEETMFVVVSKTFTTAETMMNAKTAKDWMAASLGSDPDVVKKHFVAVSSDKNKVAAFGIYTGSEQPGDTGNMFEFWDWVGGRYSATSAVGAVPLSLFLGYDKFEEILKGADWMDQHFRNTPLERNIPVLSALLDIWNINFLRISVRALLPYCQALGKLPAHTQQVEMESNGKRVDLFGRTVKFFTGEVVFGEPGTNGQHSFYQLLHQGMLVAADFIGFIKAQYPEGTNSGAEVDHQNELNTNLLAQPDALAFGKTADEVRRELAKKVSKGEMTAKKAESLVPHKTFPGNRPSSTLLLEELTPFTAGMLLAWTEHRAAVKGFVWGINSFDQWGVELGKELGVDQRIRMMKYYDDGSINTLGLTRSTTTLLEAILKGKLPT